MDLTGALPPELISDKQNPIKTCSSQYKGSIGGQNGNDFSSEAWQRTLNGKDTLQREIPAILEDEDITGQGRSIPVGEGPEAETD
jgi:hypothetical protein